MVVTIKSVVKEREEIEGAGRGAYIGNRVSKNDQKVKKGHFYEENHYKKVVQFL